MLPVPGLLLMLFPSLRDTGRAHLGSLILEVSTGSPPMVLSHTVLSSSLLAFTSLWSCIGMYGVLHSTCLHLQLSCFFEHVFMVSP